GLVTGGLHILALPLLLVFMGCYVAFVASMGLMWSAAAKTTTRALIWSLTFTLIWGGAHWFISWFLVIPFSMMGTIWPLYLLAGFTPPFVLGWSAFNWEQPFNYWSYYGSNPSPEFYGLWFCSLLGVGTSLLFAF